MSLERIVRPTPPQQNPETNNVAPEVASTTKPKDTTTKRKPKPDDVAPEEVATKTTTKRSKKRKPETDVAPEKVATKTTTKRIKKRQPDVAPEEVATKTTTKRSKKRKPDVAPEEVATDGATEPSSAPLFATLKQIRTFVQQYQHQTLTAAQPHIWEQFRRLLSQHPTWKEQWDTVTQIHVGLNFTKRATVLRLQTTRSKKFFTISWRKCHVPRRKNPVPPPASVPSDIPPVSVPSDNPPVSGVLLPASVPSAIPPLLTAALRYAVRRQIALWKRLHALGRRCVSCSLVARRLQADHVEPFSHLQRTFLAQCGLAWPTAFRFSRSTCQPIFLSQDATFKRRWQDYHRRQARLQWLCGPCNLTKGAKRTSAE